MAMKFSEVAGRVDREIKDANLKRILFRSDCLEGDDIKGIDVLYRMLTFGFIFSYAKYKHDMQTDGIRTELPNAKRVFDSYDCIFNGEDVGLDLIIYIMTEIQLDVLNYDRKSYFYGICSNRENALQIPILRGVIKTWLHSAKFAEKDNAKLLNYFVGLYEALDVLRNVEVVQGGEELMFRFLPTGELIPGYGLFMVDEENNFYYLGSYEATENNNAKLAYYLLDGSEVMRKEMPLREFKKKSYITNNENIPKSIFAKSLFSIGFKYIKNLSLAVSDTITKATKQKFYEHYSRLHSEVFDQLGYRSFEEVNWDNVLTILMFEEGPSELLEFILDSDGFYFELILKNLEIRYNEAGFVRKIKLAYEAAQTEQMELLRKYLDDNSSIVKNIISINKTLMAKCIIDGLAELENNKKHSNTQFVESLPMRIRSIDKVIMSNESMESKVIKINKALEKTFRYIIPFYYGIIAYEGYKERALANIDIRSIQNGEAEFDKQTIYEKCEEQFYAAAREKSHAISRLAIGPLIEEFRAFAKSLTQTKGHKTVISSEGRLLKAAIGRLYFCSLKTFNEILNLRDYDEEELDVSKKKPPTIVSFINGTKHSRQQNSGFKAAVFNRFLLNVKKLMYFLIYNEDYQREMLLGQQISYDPIYPYVVRYTERSENRDGYDINSFSVFYAEDTGEREIKILSEREYEINEKYYCIPNVSTSNSRWWIEPFLISCRKYDEIVSGSESENENTNP